MPSTVDDVFAAAGLTPEATVRWGTPPRPNEAGVYVVSLTDRRDQVDQVLPEPLLEEAVFDRWLGLLPELTLDAVRPMVEELVDRIRRFWLPDETIVYIGLAGTSLRRRVGDYYKTPIGAARPHAGGYFLKLLGNLHDLWVHYAQCESPSVAEDQMLAFFCANVSEATKRLLFDAEHPFPFANLEWPPGTRKRHGIKGARAPRR